MASGFPITVVGNWMRRAPVLKNLRAFAPPLGANAAILVDSGPRTGLDIARMLASGANFVFLVRALIFGIADFGANGGDHFAHGLGSELRSATGQIACSVPDQLGAYLDLSG